MERKTAFTLIGGALIGLTLAGCVAATTPDDAAPMPAKDMTPIAVVTPAPEVTPTPNESTLSLPPCPTEDSDGCYWDADTMGNGTGTDVVTPPAPAPAPAPVTKRAPRPADTERATGPVTEYDEGVLFCGVNAKPALDMDPYGNWWAYCEPALVG